MNVCSDEEKLYSFKKVSINVHTVAGQRRQLGRCVSETSSLLTLKSRLFQRFSYKGSFTPKPGSFNEISLT